MRINVLEDTSYVKSDACEEYALMHKVAENIWHNFITCSMRDMVEQDEDGWLMALNWLLKVGDNVYRAVANLKNIIKGYDYTEIRRLVPAYIWIKKGMPVLTRNSIS